MEIANQFMRGLHTDLPEISQPEGTYRYLFNAIRESDGSPKNEKGTTLISDLGASSIVGSCVLGDELIVALVGTAGSQLAILDKTDKLTVVLTNSALNFKLDYPVDIEGKVDFKGHRIIYFTDGLNPLRRADLDEIGKEKPEVVGKKISLFLQYSIPQIELNAVTETGSLPTGVYQFAARLLTDNMNKTAFSFITNPIPITNEGVSVGNKKYDGALPQTPSTKAIKLDITNVDTDYAYIEVAAITYVGTENAPKTNIVALIPITGATMQFIYSSILQDRATITLDEIVQEYAYYDTAKSVLQKDGRLLFGNLQSKEEEFDFQAVANKMVLKYGIELLSDKQEFTYNYKTKQGLDQGPNPTVIDGYRNEANAATKVTYQRKEAYSFALVPVFTGRKFGNAYHIPGVHLVDTPANASTKVLGTKVSVLHYPKGQGYPETAIRYHVMPSLEQEPLVDDEQNLRLITIQPSTPEFTPAMLEKLEGWVLVRRKRGEEDKTIISQGIAQPLIGPKVLETGLHPSPYTGRGPHVDFFGQASSYGGIEQVYRKKDIMFLSPETVLLQKDLSAATKLEAAISLVGRNYLVSDKRDGDHLDRHYWAGFMHYYKNKAIPTTSVNILSNSIVRVPQDDKPTYGLEGDLEATDYFAAPSGKKYIKRGNLGYYAMALDQDLPMEYNASTKNDEWYWDEKSGNDSVLLLQEDGTVVNQENAERDGVVFGQTRRYLYNLVADRPTQYGDVYDASYQYVGHKLIGDTTTTRFFGGDTYINRFAVQHNATDFAKFYPETDGKDIRKYYGLSYFYCESTINTAYRHYVSESDANVNETEEGEVTGTVPYFPKETKLWAGDGTGLMQYFWTLGHPRGYNKQYSKENSIRPFFPKQLGQVTVSNFSNRLIYSELGIEGEQADSYRTFLVNNYHDLPRNKGEITDMFEHRGSLFLHTGQSLFKAFFNEKTTQATSSGEVVLGNGGLFPIPSEEIMTVDGGYAGTLHKFASCSTPFGRFFVDAVQKKVFMFGEQLKEISDQGMFNYFLKVIKTHQNMRSVYDYQHKRWILTSGEWTLSYAPQLDSWTGWHAYKPTHMVSKGNRVFVESGGLYELGTGTYGVYFKNTVEPMKLSFVVNTAVTVTKQFDSCTFHVTSQKNGLESQHDMFNLVRFSNKAKNTDWCEIIVPKTFLTSVAPLGKNQVHAKRRVNEFRIAIPSDLVIDPEVSIFAETNLHKDRKFRPRINGKYMLVELEYSNKTNNSFQLHALETEVRQTPG